jgi:ABC-type sulfate transport system permease component
VARAAEAAATDVAQSGELIEKVVGFQPHDLGVASFITLSIAFLTILGGLIWCFSRAMAAAGSGDVELPEESN